MSTAPKLNIKIKEPRVGILEDGTTWILRPHDYDTADWWAPNRSHGHRAALLGGVTNHVRAMVDDTGKDIVVNDHPRITFGVLVRVVRAGMHRLEGLRTLKTEKERNAVKALWAQVYVEAVKVLDHSPEALRAFNTTLALGGSEDGADSKLLESLVPEVVETVRRQVKEHDRDRRDADRNYKQRLAMRQLSVWEAKLQHAEQKVKHWRRLLNERTKRIERVEAERKAGK